MFLNKIFGNGRKTKNCVNILHLILRKGMWNVVGTIAQTQGNFNEITAMKELNIYLHTYNLSTNMQSDQPHCHMRMHQYTIN